MQGGESCGNIHVHRIGTRNKGNRKLRVEIYLWQWASMSEATVDLGARFLAVSPWERAPGSGRRKLTQVVAEASRLFLQVRFSGQLVIPIHLRVYKLLRAENLSIRESQAFYSYSIF